ncbi:Di-copper centre-containing protein [Parathielavia appendiculata]|uniref:Di-copper centre-containing protein n=1 Tax=Parathielavia appendiculata TaxID=2587402 RepID=A0AAN6U965_9PEZI|nr:Di-copper centre-containing protein [Parathielavia appendiculata]
MMRFRLSLLIFLTSLANVFAISQYAPYDYGFDISRRVKREVARRSELVLQPKTSSDLVVRQEIRQLEQDKDVWTLYILGLSMLQFTDQASPASYYGLAGIHGMPHVVWGGVQPVQGNENTGYCTHSSILFPTWHRAYMALYEMIASFWPESERPRYEAAARRFRIPYWDWAAPPPPGESVLPLSIGGSPFVDVNGPNGVQRIANPLFSYNFRPLDTKAFSFGPWNTWTRTLRGPSSTGPDAQSNNSLVAMNLDQNRGSLAQRLYTLFSGYDNYTTFSSNAFGPQADSVESIHDTIHGLVGGFGPGQASSQAGHMGYLQWSAFDPIFFLHHTMVDRILAIWQTLHPTAWITPSRSLTNSYTIRKGQVLSSNTALAPFFSHDNGSFWDSDGVRDHTKFGYTYAELLGPPTFSHNMAVTAQVRTVRQAVNRMYGSFSPASLFLKELRASGFKTSSGKATTGHNFSRSTMAGKIFVGDRYHEWTANVGVGKQALDGDGVVASSVNFFLGDAPRDPREWTATTNHVGTMGVFASVGGYGISGNQGGAHDVAVSGTVPLTAALMKKVAAGELASLRPRDVEPYLKGNLKGIVLGRKGEVLTECVDGIMVGIVSSEVTAPWSEEELPRWEEGKISFEMC